MSLGYGSAEQEDCHRGHDCRVLTLCGQLPTLRSRWVACFGLGNCGTGGFAQFYERRQPFAFRVSALQWSAFTLRFLPDRPAGGPLRGLPPVVPESAASRYGRWSAIWRDGGDCGAVRGRPGSLPRPAWRAHAADRRGGFRDSHGRVGGGLSTDRG